MILASDQGTIVTVNGGKNWSSWNNQPTAQLYNVTTDNRSPYWIYGAQQDSNNNGGSAASAGPNGGPRHLRYRMGDGVPWGRKRRRSGESAGEG
jgi:hypothetical protein